MPSKQTRSTLRLGIKGSTRLWKPSNVAEGDDDCEADAVEGRAGSLIYTDEYNVYDRLQQWGYAHKRVNHFIGEYARDEDGDGFHEVHVNALEGFWSLLRSWLRPHRGISQEKLPWYLGFFEFVHNIRRRGKALLHSLLATLVAA